MGLAQVYKKYCLQAAGGKEASQQISWIKDKLLHIYYQTSIDDRSAKWPLSVDYKNTCMVLKRFSCLCRGASCYRVVWVATESEGTVELSHGGAVKKNICPLVAI